jgi:Protein of unknown function (DUF3307)
MLTLHEIFIILIVHWIADFILQTDADAKGKSTSFKHLLSHTSTYWLVWISVAISLSGFIDLKIGILFSIITFFAHTITDYFTSKWVKKSFDKQDFHNGFVKIGFDQLLHYGQLFLTYYYLKFLK